MSQAKFTMKKNSRIIAGLIVFFVFLFGFVLGFEQGRRSESFSKGLIAVHLVENGETAFVGDFSVVRVIDGDTIEIEGGERVRYIGIDSPESIGAENGPECFGAEAWAKNQELVGGKMVRLEKDTSERDKFGRLLRYVYVGDVFVNQELVRLGFARAVVYPPDIAHQTLIFDAEKEARDFGSGLWSACLGDFN